MNLWVLFPESLLKIPGILQLPYLALVAALVTLIFAWKIKCLKHFFAFLGCLVSLDTYILFNIGPGMGRIAIPLILMTMMTLPAIAAINAWFTKNKRRLLFWVTMTFLALLHSVSWAVWIMALASS